MNENQYYESLRNRFQTACFKQDDVPSLETIEKILKESVESTPVFGLDYHHSVKVFGPNYAEDKRKVCWQTCEHDKTRKMFDANKKDQPNIETLDKYLNYFIQDIKNNNAKETSYNKFQEDALTFSMQVMAPYLLVFKFDPDKYIHKDKKEALKNKKTKALQSSMAHALSVAIIAEHYGVDSGFCGCFFKNSHNKNKIFYNDEDVWLFVGLGYKEDWCHKAKGSLNYEERQSEKPKLEDIIELT